jgi:hypothetical protein
MPVTAFESLKRELMLLKKYATPYRTLPKETRTQLYVQLKSIELVQLIEERYALGLDLELDLLRLMGKGSPWPMPDFSSEQPTINVIQPDAHPGFKNEFLNPVVVRAFATCENKQSADVATLVKYLPLVNGG